MKHLSKSTLLWAWFIGFCAWGVGLTAQASVTVTVDPKVAGSGVPADFIGLSFETEKALPNNGKYFFRAENKPLIALFHTLGIKSLRIGGNTADRPTIKVPSTSDLDSLFAFAKAAEVRVIYTLRMRDGEPKDAAELAKHIMEHYKPLLACFAIGNEPNVFSKEYPAYREAWQKYMEAVTAAAPEARFCGPSATPGKTAWARDFVHDFGRSGRIVFITQHDYPGGAGNKATNVVAARDKMLSPTWLDHYEQFYQSFASEALSNGLPYRLEEANNFYNGGAKDVSDTFAAALWGLDYLHWWAAHRAAGINFHTGDQVAAGELMNSCRYATFWTSPDGYNVHPIGYGIKAFDLGSHGQAVPATVAGSGNGNLTAYSVLAPDKGLCVTLINKEHGAVGRSAEVTINVGAPYVHGEMMLLTAPQADVAAKSGVTLGGAAIKDDGSWTGAWSPVAARSAPGAFTVTVPTATAAIVKLSPE